MIRIMLMNRQASGTPSTDRSTSKSWSVTRDPMPELESCDAPVRSLSSAPVHRPPSSPLLVDGTSPVKATNTNHRLLQDKQSKEIRSSRKRRRPMATNVSDARYLASIHKRKLELAVRCNTKA